MDSIDDAARKYGGKFDDNIKMQSLWADELDKMFGASARTSLMGDMEKAMPAALDVATGGQTLYGAAAQKAGDMLDGARGVNTEAALSAAGKNYLIDRYLISQPIKNRQAANGRL